MEVEEIKKLADLARIDMNEEEMKGIAHDFEAILAYVSQVKEVSKLLGNSFYYNLRNDSISLLENITREDVATENLSTYPDKIIKQMPDVDDRYLKVKQIL